MGTSRNCFDRARAEFRTLISHELRDFGAPPTGYHVALLDPECGDPDNDPELVEIQLAYAASFMRRTATLGAIEVAIGPGDYHSIETQLASMERDEQLGATWMDDLASQAKDAHWWNDAVARWAIGVRRSRARWDQRRSRGTSVVTSVPSPTNSS